MRQSRAMQERVRTKTCPVCGHEFSYEVGLGKDRKHCSAKCRVSRQLSLRATVVANAPKCSTDGCNKRAMYRTVGLCQPCYFYVRRNNGRNPVERLAEKEPKRFKGTHGYMMLYRPGHPLAHKNRAVGEHRFVMFEALGPGHHPCHWCGTSVDWPRICIDHLNDKKDDNRLANLVVSCEPCNILRGALTKFAKVATSEALAQAFELMRMVNTQQPNVL